MASRPLTKEEAASISAHINEQMRIYRATETPAPCDCPADEWIHEYDEDSRLGDWYYCGLCGEVTQVG